jgi:hypothetical protein
MVLELEDGTTIERPTDAQIHEALATLQGDMGNEFAILGQNEMTYMQAAPMDEGYVLEFQEGDTNHHYQAVDLLPLSAVIEAFQMYQRGDETWKLKTQWQRIDL